MRFLKRWWWLLPALLVLAVGGFVLWAGSPARPMPEALAALVPDGEVQVEIEPWLVFRPQARGPAAGLILYPGGRIDPRAYAPAAHALARQGYLVVIAPMPLNLAVLAPDRAADVIAAFPEIGRWAVAGHSLGGAMAARFAYQNPEIVQGLVLWAAYPASTDDLSGYALAVTSISGTLDGLSTPTKIAASRTLLPARTRWVAIEGGNHAQFGWYGLQPGDGTAAISREEQQKQIVAATADLLSLVAAPGHWQAAPVAGLSLPGRSPDRHKDNGGGP
jgi:pimeloyl-ACP methyl ester carboxylesterase